MEGMTLFSMPKPFRGHFRVIQRNAIQSWTLLSPRPEIILFGDEEGTAEAAADFGLKHCPSVERNERATPLVNSIFSKAEAMSRGRLMAYVNADIVLLTDFMDAVRRLEFRRFLMVAQRWDLDITEALDFDSEDWEALMRERVFRDAVRHGPSGIDFFVFPRGLWREVPPFALGRTAWDNWLLRAAIHRGAILVDATPVVMQIHQNHDYGHVAGGADAAWKGPEAQRNSELAAGLYASLEDADCLLTEDGFRWHPSRRRRVVRALERNAWLRLAVLSPLRRARTLLAARWRGKGVSFRS